MRGWMESLLCTGLSEVSGERASRFGGRWLKRSLSRGGVLRSATCRAFLKSDRGGSEARSDDGEVRAGSDEGTVRTGLHALLTGRGSHEDMAADRALKMSGAVHVFDLRAQGLEAVGERRV